MIAWHRLQKVEGYPTADVRSIGHFRSHTWYYSWYCEVSDILSFDI